MYNLLYYIGGPNDGIRTVRVPPMEPRILVRQIGRLVPKSDRQERALAEYEDHTYYVRKIGKDTFVAVHESLV